MKRRVVLTALAVSVLGGTALPALASTDSPSNTHTVCITGSKTPTGPSEGICVWVPLPVAAPQ